MEILRLNASKYFKSRSAGVEVVKLNAQVKVLKKYSTILLGVLLQSS